MAVITIAENAQFGDVATHRIGPWTNALGHLYVIAVDKAALQVNAWKSSDQGYTWLAIEGPAGLSDLYTSEIEGVVIGDVYPRSVAVARSGNKLWCVYPTGPTLELVACAFDVETDAWGNPFPGGPALAHPELFSSHFFSDEPFLFFVEALSDGSLVVVYNSDSRTWFDEIHLLHVLPRSSITTFAADVPGKASGWGSKTLVMPADADPTWGASPLCTVLGEDDIVHCFFGEYLIEGPVAYRIYFGSWNGGAFTGATIFLEDFGPNPHQLFSVGMPARRQKDGGAKQIVRIAVPVQGSGVDAAGLSIFYTDFSATDFTQQVLTSSGPAYQYGGFEFDDGDMGVLTSPTFSNPDPEGIRLEVWRATDGAFAREPDQTTVPGDYYWAVARGANNAVGVLIRDASSEAIRYITLGGAAADIVGVNGIPSSVAFGQTSGVRGGEDQQCEPPGAPSMSEGDCGPSGPIEPPDRELHPRCAYAMAL